MPGKPISLTDFSGGYVTDLADELKESGMVDKGVNCYWREGIRKRQGKVDYGETGTGTPTALRGQIRVRMNDTWLTLLAVDNGSEVNIHSDYTTAKAFVEISSPTVMDLTTGKNVKFTELDHKIVGVNGTDDTFVVYYDSGMKIQTMDAYDTRSRTTDDWYAGKYDVSEDPKYIDYTDEAQSVTVNDFPLATAGTNNDGFYVAGVLAFNKFIITSASQFDGSPVANYQYYKGSDTWGDLTMVQTPSWTAVAGDRTFEFDIPLDWATWDGNEADDGAGSPMTGSMAGRMVIRVRFTTAPTSAQTADFLDTIEHTQYLTQVLDGEVSSHVKIHGDRVWLAGGIIVNYSEFRTVTGWEPYFAEYFQEGGDEIVDMVSHNQYLAIFKGAAIHGVYGNNFENWSVRKLADIGAVSGTAKVVGQKIWFLGTDGFIYGWTGVAEKRVSKHIQSDIDGYTHLDAVAIQYQNDYFISFPTNEIILRFDPDTYRDDEMGDGRVSFWKYTGIDAASMVCHKGDSDNGKLLAIDDTKLIEIENGNYYDATDTAIAIDFQTKEYSFGTFQQKKIYTRAKPDVSKAGNWTFTMYADHQAQNVATTLASGTGSGQYTEDVSIPYNLDGKNLAFRFQNSSVVDARIYGVAVDIARRAY